MRHLPRWMTACFLLLAASLMLLSCRSGGGAASSWEGEIKTNLTVPPGIEASLLEPITGEALERAALSSAQAFEQLALSTDPPSPSPHTSPLTDEPPRAAQLAYVHGRTALREGNREEALAQLEQALRLSPNSAHILRLLGQIYIAANNPIRGVQYLDQAVKIDPTHVPSLFQLGRFAMVQGDWARGTALVHQAMQRNADASPTNVVIRQLGHYYLGLALAKLGYPLAAVEQYQAYLADHSSFRGNHNLARERRMLEHQKRTTYQQVGDLFNQLNRPEDARTMYQAAVEVNDRPLPFDLIQRQVYTQLKRHHTRDAVQQVLGHVSHTHGSASALAMVRYLAHQGVSAAKLAQELQTIYDNDAQARTGVMAMTIADLRGNDQILIAHLERHPDDARVFDQLLTGWLASEEKDSQARRQVIVRTADLMERYPSNAEMFGLMMLRAMDDPVALSEVFDQLPSHDRQRVMVLVLRGLAFANIGQIDPSEQAFEQALALEPNVAIARLQLAKVKVARGQFDQAAKLLEAMADSEDPSVIALRVRVLTNTGASAQALALLDKMIAAGEVDISLVLQKARLQLVLGDADAAERTLLDMLNLRPKEETLYEALFQLYEQQNAQRRPLIRDSDAQYRRLMRRMLGKIPESRISKLKRAELHAAGREFGQAIALLTSLVEQDRHDRVALMQLLDVLIESGQGDHAITLMDKRLEENGRDPELLRLAIAFYQRVGDQAKMRVAQEKLYELLPEGDDRLFGLASLYLVTDRSQQAIAMLEQALDEASTDDPVMLVAILIHAKLRLDRDDEVDADFRQALEKYPEHEADLRYRWANSYVQRGDRESSVRVLVETHERFPDHAATNNDLGYLWVENHEHLDEALQMIRRAVEVEPTNAAYLDSLGWAYYKLGQFDDAVVWLRKSIQQARTQQQRGALEMLTTQVVVFDHLGDALYRQGDPGGANVAWQQARKILKKLTVEDEEILKVQEALAHKMAAHKQNLPVPIAEVPQPQLTEPPNTEI